MRTTLEYSFYSLHFVPPVVIVIKSIIKIFYMKSSVNFDEATENISSKSNKRKV